MDLAASHDDKFHEECGVFGVWNVPDAAAITALGLHALQHRGQEALGIELTRSLERGARHLGIVQLYLLTTTAEQFFARLGYRVIPRDRAPAEIQGTTEYRELCASTSVCMVRDLEEE